MEVVGSGVQGWAFCCVWASPLCSPSLPLPPPKHTEQQAPVRNQRAAATPGSAAAPPAALPHSLLLLLPGAGGGGLLPWNCGLKMLRGQQQSGGGTSVRVPVLGQRAPPAVPCHATPASSRGALPPAVACFLMGP